MTPTIKCPACSAIWSEESDAREMIREGGWCPKCRDAELRDAKARLFRDAMDEQVAGSHLTSTHDAELKEAMSLGAGSARVHAERTGLGEEETRERIWDASLNAGINHMVGQEVARGGDGLGGVVRSIGGCVRTAPDRVTQDLLLENGDAVRVRDGAIMDWGHRADCPTLPDGTLEDVQGAYDEVLAGGSGGMQSRLEANKAAVDVLMDRMLAARYSELSSDGRSRLIAAAHDVSLDAFRLIRPDPSAESTRKDGDHPGCCESAGRFVWWDGLVAYDSPGDDPTWAIMAAPHLTSTYHSDLVAISYCPWCGEKLPE